MGLKEKLEKKLEGGKFRLLNEKMYKNIELSSKEADEYHVYYENQIKKWPNDPKKMVIEKIKENEHSEKLIADLGCGSALLADTFKQVKSYDKYPMKPSVCKSTIDKVKAQNEEFEVAVCCLSLMKNNITGELKEINRILKKEGIFYYAEVSSRINNTKKLINDIEKIGFKLKSLDSTNKYFKLFIFTKSESLHDGEKKKLPSVMLQEWKYKKR